MVGVSLDRDPTSSRETNVLRRVVGSRLDPDRVVDERLRHSSTDALAGIADIATAHGRIVAAEVRDIELREGRDGVGDLELGAVVEARNGVERRKRLVVADR